MHPKRQVDRHAVLIDSWNPFSLIQECHFVPHQGLPLLHRAFSLFLFRYHQDEHDGQAQLLMQRRSLSKLTYPGLWSNTCCSHPLANVEGEAEEAGAVGVKRAAQRKVDQLHRESRFVTAEILIVGFLRREMMANFQQPAFFVTRPAYQLQHELGMDASRVLPLSHLHYLTRILYNAPNTAPGDPQWAEHELDYILVGLLDDNRKQWKDNQQSTNQSTCIDDFTCNPDEVSEARWLSWTDLQRQMGKKSGQLQNSFTPWFWRITSGGYLQRIWTWVEAFRDANPGQRFTHLNASWDRGAIIRLDSMGS